MKLYKIIFSHNLPIICKPATHISLNDIDKMTYEEDKNKKQLIYTIINADSEDKAMREAQKISKLYMGEQGARQL